MLGVKPNTNSVAYTGSLLRLQDAIPIVAGAGVLGLAAYDVHKAPEHEKKERFLSNLFLISAGVVLFGVIFHKWIKAHPLINKLFNNSEHTLEHFAAHTSPEGAHLLSKSAALREIIKKSSGKSAAEVQTLIRRVMPLEAERVIPALFGKIGGQEAELLASRAEAEIPGLVRSLPALKNLLNKSAGKTTAEIQAIIRKTMPVESERIIAGLFGKTGAYEAELFASRAEAELPYLAKILPALESKIPFLESSAERIVAEMLARRSIYFAELGRKTFYA
ncbi:MAG: hypothetical protein AB1782_20860 [Cyanobacteriota bacterium]